MLGKKGFTLIELIVVMAIIGILAAAVLVNSGKNEDRDIRQEAERFSAYLREVQNKALAADTVSGVSGKVCGFGAYREDDQNILTYYVATRTDALGLIDEKDVDCAKDMVVKKYDETNSENGDNSECAELGGADVFVFKNNVEIGTDDDDFKDVFFLIPYGTVYKDGVALGGTPVDFDFKKGTTYSLDDLLHLNSAGQIY